jgi:tetratricopeptide (TPR) repeat protein
MGRYADGKAHLEESLAIARELGDKESTELVLQPLAMASLGQGNRVAAKMWLEQALDLANELGNKRERAAALNGLAQIHRMDGQLDQAEPLYYDVVALARELGDRDSVAIGLLNIAMVAIERGRLQRIDATLLEVLAISEEIESRQAGQSLLEVSAGLAAAREQWNIVARFYGAAEAQALETSLHRDPTDEAFLAPLIGRTKEALGALYAAAEDGGRALKYEEAMVEVRKWLTQQSQPTLAP